MGEVTHPVCIKEGNNRHSAGKSNLVLGNVLANDLRRCDAEEVPGLPRHGSLDHENPEVVVDLDNFELPDLGLGSSHPPGHLLPLVHTPRRCSCTDGTQLPVALGTVSHQPTLEVVPLDTTCTMSITDRSETFLYEQDSTSLDKSDIAKLTIFNSFIHLVQSSQFIKSIKESETKFWHE